MSVLTNIKFNYLYRDAGNYKQYGSVVYTNKCNLSLNQIKNAIRKNLIDGEFFIAHEWGIPSLFFEASNSDDHQWHEFYNVETTTGIESSVLDIRELISQISLTTANRSSIY